MVRNEHRRVLVGGKNAIGPQHHRNHCSNSSPHALFCNVHFHTLMGAGRAPLAARVAMSARIAPKRTITPPEWIVRSTMIHAIGAMHAALRAHKRLEDKTKAVAGGKSGPRTRQEGDGDEKQRRDNKTRGQRA